MCSILYCFICNPKLCYHNFFLNALFCWVILPSFYTCFSQSELFLIYFSVLLFYINIHYFTETMFSSNLLRTQLNLPKHHLCFLQQILCFPRNCYKLSVLLCIYTWITTFFQGPVFAFHIFEWNDYVLNSFHLCSVNVLFLC